MTAKGKDSILEDMLITASGIFVAATIFSVVYLGAYLGYHIGKPHKHKQKSAQTTSVEIPTNLTIKQSSGMAPLSPDANIFRRLVDLNGNHDGFASEKEISRVYSSMGIPTYQRPSNTQIRDYIENNRAQIPKL